MTGRDRIVVVGSRPSPCSPRSGCWRSRPSAKRPPRSVRSQRRAGAAHQRRKSALQRQRRAGQVPDRLRLDRGPRQSRTGRAGSALVDLSARAGDRPEKCGIRLDHGRRLKRRGSDEHSLESERRRRGQLRRAASPPWRARALRRCRSRSCSTAASRTSTASFSSSTASRCTRARGALRVSGRLLTVQSVKLAPATSGSETGPGKKPSEQLSGTITATAYVLPAGQTLTGGATPAGPTGTATQTASTGASSSTSTNAPAVVRVNP